MHLDLLAACKRHAQGRYFVGCPDLIEGLDTLAGMRGTQPVLLDTVDRPEALEQELQAINDVWFTVLDAFSQEVAEYGEMSFFYFSIWGPGRVAKLQSDISIMISPKNFRRFVQPYIRQQCQWLDYSLYHLDGVGAIRHLDALLEIEELDALQWTPGVGQPQGGDPCWYDLYTVSYTHLRDHETVLELVCRLLHEKKKQTKTKKLQLYFPRKTKN